MRKYLNNPYIVLPAAFCVLLLVLFQYNREYIEKLFSKKDSNNIILQKPVPDMSLNTYTGNGWANYVTTLSLNNWNDTNTKGKDIKDDPFVRIDGDAMEKYFYNKNGVGYVELLSKFITDNIRLDEEGFFIVFREQKIRENDKVGTQTIHRINVPLANSKGLEESAKNYIDSLTLEAIYINGADSSAQISGKVYVLGELISKSPVLALHSVGEAFSTIIAPSGKTWTIEINNSVDNL
tara:strand:- start:875 stop:1585 length:711 start_codon:yes stop_codon:yes gene_type:complete